MSKNIITIDTGTTNTRTFLWDKNRKMIASAASETGVRNTAIDNNNYKLKEAIKKCIEEMLIQSNMTYEDVSAIIASGMITSNVGLIEIPHVYAPASITELADNAKLISIKEICPIPILFIPGIKNNIEIINIENIGMMDIMRGEEVESFAILDHFSKGKPYIIVLPGSHTKFVAVDKQGRITGCLTTITGELLSSITKDTIIADAVEKEFVTIQSYDKEFFLKGFEISAENGIGRAAFITRLLKMFVEKDTKKLSSFLLGVLLAGDIQALNNSNLINNTDKNIEIIVSGKNPLRRALIDGLNYDGFFTHINEFIPDENMPLSAYGACLIADIINKI